MPKTKEYEVSQKGYEALGANTLAKMIRNSEKIIEVNTNLIRLLTSAYKNVVNRKERM